MITSQRLLVHSFTHNVQTSAICCFFSSLTVSVKALWSLSIITKLLLWGWTTNFRGVYRKGVATWLNTAPSFSRAKILPEKMQFVTKFPLEEACETSTNRVSVAVVSIFRNKSHVLGGKVACVVGVQRKRREKRQEEGRGKN